MESQNKQVFHSKRESSVISLVAESFGIFDSVGYLCSRYMAGMGGLIISFLMKYEEYWTANSCGEVYVRRLYLQHSQWSIVKLQRDRPFFQYCFTATEMLLF